MSVNCPDAVTSSDLYFLHESNRIYRPLTVESTISADGKITLEVINTSTVAKKDVGIYVGIAKCYGSVDYPADFGPYVDFDHILTWGNAVVAGNETYGGLILIKSTGDEVRFSRKNGSSYKNKISIGEILSGSKAKLELKLEVPPSVTSRRLFISIKAE